MTVPVQELLPSDAAVAQRIAHLQMIRHTIITYELMSLAMKFIALAVGGSAFVLVGFGHASEGTIKLSLIASGVITFLLWLADAHFRQTKWGFIALHDAAREGRVTMFEMSPKLFKTRATFHRAVWAAPHPWLYKGISAITLLLIFMQP
ncbi:MAG: hypothetical protein HQL38_03370 [Alphaproteobacteria bacterium]|nr:hypothetical protein [Alphaproteobacteria bacterium]